MGCPHNTRKSFIILPWQVGLSLQIQDEGLMTRCWDAGSDLFQQTIVT